MSPRPRHVQLQVDLFRQPQPPKEPPQHAPYQPKSATSAEAAERITKGPAFHGNRLACLREIARLDDTTGATRKSIAEKYFAGKMNYTTGPVAQLIEEGLVYEEPDRNPDGSIKTRVDGTIIPRRIEHSAVLKLTPKGKAVTKREEAA